MAELVARGFGQQLDGLKRQGLQGQGKRADNKVYEKIIKKDQLLKIGDLYEFWGTGLIFNMLDDQSIDMDTGIRGGLFSYNFGFLSAEYLIGDHQSFRSTTKAPDFDERIPNYKTDYKLQAGKISFDISRNRFEFFALNVKDQHLIPTKNQYLSSPDL